MNLALPVALIIVLVPNGLPFVPELRNPVAELTGPCELSLPATNSQASWRITISQGAPDRGSPWPEDILELRLYCPADVSQPDPVLEFESSYGLFELDLVDLTGDGVEEFVLISGQGRGTSARSETLRVFAVRGGRFKQMLELGVSDYFGSGYRWRYRREYANIRNQGVLSDPCALLLKLELTGSAYRGSPSLAFPSLIPKAETIECVYDTGADVMRINGDVRHMPGLSQPERSAPNP